MRSANVELTWISTSRVGSCSDIDDDGLRCLTIGTGSIMVSSQNSTPRSPSVSIFAWRGSAGAQTTTTCWSGFHEALHPSHPSRNLEFRVSTHARSRACRCDLGLHA